MQKWPKNAKNDPLSQKLVKKKKSTLLICIVYMKHVTQKCDKAENNTPEPENKQHGRQWLHNIIGMGIPTFYSSHTAECIPEIANKKGTVSQKFIVNYSLHVIWQKLCIAVIKVGDVDKIFLKNNSLTMLVLELLQNK